MAQACTWIWHHCQHKNWTWSGCAIWSLPGTLGAPSAAELSIREQEQALSSPRALSNWPGPQRSVAGEEMLCPGPFLQVFLSRPVWYPRYLQSSVHPEIQQELGLFNTKALLPFQSRSWISPDQAQMEKQILHCPIYNLIIRRNQNAL